MNFQVFTGRLTNDPEDMKNGVVLRIAVRRDYKSSEGEYESDFFSFKAFQNAARYCRENLKRGSMVEIRSTAKNNNWKDPETNKMRYQNDFIVEQVRQLQKAQTHHEVLENSY